MVTDGADPARRALVLAALGPFVALVWYYLQSGGRRVVGSFLFHVKMFQQSRNWKKKLTKD